MLSDLLLGSEDKALLDDTNQDYQESNANRVQNESTNSDQLITLNSKSLSQKRRLYGRSATAYSCYRQSSNENRSLSVEDAEDLAQSLIDKPILFDDELAPNTQFATPQYTADYKPTEHLIQAELVKSENRTRTSSGSGSHQFATNFNNRKARHQQPFSRQFSLLEPAGGLLASTYSTKRGSPTSSSQFINQLAAAKTSHSVRQSHKKPFLSQSTIDTHKLTDNENLIIDDFISAVSNTGKLTNIGRKSTVQSGESSESARLSESGLKQPKSAADDSVADGIELRNMTAKSSKLTAATSLGSSGGGGVESVSRNNSAAGSGGSPIASDHQRQATRPTTFTLNMPQTNSVPGSPKESTNLMRQFSDRDEISLYGTPKEEMPHGGFHGDSRTANFMRNQIGK